MKENQVKVIWYLCFEQDFILENMKYCFHIIFDTKHMILCLFISTKTYFYNTGPKHVLKHMTTYVAVFSCVSGS